MARQRSLWTHHLVVCLRSKLQWKGKGKGGREAGLPLVCSFAIAPEGNAELKNKLHPFILASELHSKNRLNGRSAERDQRSAACVCIQLRHLKPNDLNKSASCVGKSLRKAEIGSQPIQLLGARLFSRRIRMFFRIYVTWKRCATYTGDFKCPWWWTFSTPKSWKEWIYNTTNTKL